MEFITTLIHQIVELFAKLQAGGQEAAELFQAFLKFVGDILRFLEEHGLSKQIVDAIFQLILKIFGAACCLMYRQKAVAPFAGAAVFFVAFDTHIC